VSAEAAPGCGLPAQLVEAETGNHVWAERYDRDIGDIFAVQDEITERVVAAIEPELYAAEDIRSQRKPPESLDAWECVIRALSAIGLGTRETNDEAERLCRRAIAISPRYGQAHSLLSWALLRSTMWAGDLPKLAPEISAEAQTALALDERDPWAHLAQGNLFNRLHRSAEAERELRRGLELNPNFALAHALLGASLAARGSHQAGIDSARHASRLSPNDRSVSMFASMALMAAHVGAGSYAECVSWARLMTETHPEHLAGHIYLTAALAMQGEMTEATDALAPLLRLRPELSLAWMRQNLPPTGKLAERIYEALRRVGVPEG
jgi:tetratricopeptide (TPR) repeat protein